MSVEATLAAGRRAAEALMLSRCRIVHLNEVTLDTVTLNLNDDDPADDVVYEGPCRVKAASARVFVIAGEGQTIDRQDLSLHLPVAAGAVVPIGAQATITDGGPDPALTGRTFRVIGVPSATLATQARFAVEHEG